MSERGWWGRNWKWVVPTGCLMLVVLAAAAVFGVFSLVMMGIRSAEAYQGGVAKARLDCEVQEALGAPVEPRWWVTGSIDVEGPSGEAELAIPLRGARDQGTLYVEATKGAGRWRFDRVEVEVAGRAERIDLMSGDRKSCGS